MTDLGSQVMDIGTQRQSADAFVSPVWLSECNCDFLIDEYTKFDQPSFIFRFSRASVIKNHALFDTVICPRPECNYLSIFSADIGITEEKVTAFLREATLMSNFNHANVLDLIGVVYTDGYMPAVVLPFMHRGDIRALIQSEDEV